MRAWMHRALQRWALTSFQKMATRDDQRIVFDLSAAVGYPLVVKVSPWRSPTPFAWVSETHQEPLAWGEFLAPAGIGWQALMNTHGEALTRGMPAEVTTLVNAVSFLGMELAQLTGRHPAALDLAVSSPLLLVLLTEKAIEHQWSEPYLSSLLRKKQSELCGYAGLPSTQAAAKLLRRCALTPMIGREFIALKRALMDPRTTPLLRHHPAPYAQQLIFLGNYQGERWPGLLALIDEALNPTNRTHNRTWLTSLLEDTHRLDAANLSRLRCVRSLAELQALHDRRIANFNARNAAQSAVQSDMLDKRYGPFPNAPLPNQEGICALTSWDSLLLEGKRMQHCVGSYHSLVAQGSIAIYHMSHPEHLTVAIAPLGDKWVLSQARGKRNAIPSEQALQAVMGWLGEQ